MWRMVLGRLEGIEKRRKRRVGFIKEYEVENMPIENRIRCQSSRGYGDERLRQQRYL